MATFNDTFELFPSAEYDTRVILTNLYIFLENLSMKCVSLEFYLCFPGVALTIFHLTILTRKSMRTSSIMSLMIGIAISDLISMLDAIGYRDIVLNFELQECTPPLTFLEYHAFSVMQAIRDDAIRCSTWLSVTMALIRYLVLKLAVKGGSPLISGFSFGFKSLGVASFISTLFTIGFFLRVKVVLVGEWKPAESCPNHENLPTVPIYDTLPSDLFTAYNGLFLRVFMCLNGFVSKILPCILFPILTGLLILELQEAQKSRASDKRAERTTGLVIFMTVSFFIALLPAGLITSLQAVYTDVGFLYMSTFVDIICASLLSLNSCLHCFICSAMSTQYRKIVKEVLRISEVIRIDKGSDIIKGFKSRNKVLPAALVELQDIIDKLIRRPQDQKNHIP